MNAIRANSFYSPNYSTIGSQSYLFVRGATADTYTYAPTKIKSVVRRISVSMKHLHYRRDTRSPHAGDRSGCNRGSEILNAPVAPSRAISGADRGGGGLAVGLIVEIGAKTTRRTAETGETRQAPAGTLFRGAPVRPSLGRGGRRAKRSAHVSP